METTTYIFRVSTPSQTQPCPIPAGRAPVPYYVPHDLRRDYEAFSRLSGREKAQRCGAFVEAYREGVERGELEMAWIEGQERLQALTKGAPYAQ
jgi:hypothetical protein